MISEFLTSGGNLNLPRDTPEGELPPPQELGGDTFRERTQIRGFGNDGYWTCE